MEVLRVSNGATCEHRSPQIHLQIDRDITRHSPPDVDPEAATVGQGPGKAIGDIVDQDPKLSI